MGGLALCSDLSICVGGNLQLQRPARLRFCLKIYVCCLRLRNLAACALTTDTTQATLRNGVHLHLNILYNRILLLRCPCWLLVEEVAKSTNQNQTTNTSPM